MNKRTFILCAGAIWMIATSLLYIFHFAKTVLHANPVLHAVESSSDR